MSKPEIAHTSIDVAQVGAPVDSQIAQVRNAGTRVLVEQDGVAVAAIISERDLRRLSELEAQDEADYETLARIAERFKDAPDEEIEREVAAAIAEVRADHPRTHPPRRTAQ